MSRAAASLWTLVAVGLCASAAHAASEPNPFFSTPPAPKHTVTKPRASVKPPTPSKHATTIPRLPTPASARIHPSGSSKSPVLKPKQSITPFKAPKVATAKGGVGSLTPRSAIPGTRRLGWLGGRRQRANSSSPTTTAIIAAIIAGLVIIACLAWGITRLLVLEPRWLSSLRHSLDEAGLRASTTFAEFADWVRLGR
jgi:hypothetical protein